MKFDFIYIDPKDWEYVKIMALTTIHKKHTSKEISDDWRRKILISRHSPIRELRIRFKITELKRWIADQLVRHTVGVNNGMGSMREDKIAIPRDKQTMEFETELYQSHNAESLINLMETRLCLGCVSKETRELCENLKDEIEEIEPELAFLFVPSCIRNGYCKEFNSCGHLESYLKYLWQEVSGFSIFTFADCYIRYSNYHYWRKVKK